MDNTLKSLEALYIDGKYDQAIEALLSVKDAVSPGLFHYNLGTLYAKSEQFAAGRYHLEKAIHEGYITTYSLNNLAAVREKLQVADLSSSTHWWDIAMDFGTRLPESAYLTITLVAALIVAIFFARKKIRGLKSLLVGLLLSCVPYAIYYGFFSDIQSAIVLENAQILEGPSKIFKSKGTLVPGAKILVRQGDPGWSYIWLPTELSGWIETTHVGIF
jgi:hypothetical protein